MKNYKMTLSLLAFIFILGSSSFLRMKTDISENSNLGGWVKLGTQTVSPGANYDELHITEATESFNRLKIKVLKAPVYIRNIHVVYEDNTSEGHIIKRNFKKGEASRILDLVGYERIIKKIIFNYSRRNSGPRQAHLDVLAKI